MLQTLAKMGDAQESKYGKSFLGHAGERRGVRRITDISVRSVEYYGKPVG